MSVRKGIPDQHDHVAAKVVRRLARGIFDPVVARELAPIFSAPRNLWAGSTMKKALLYMVLKELVVSIAELLNSAPAEPTEAWNNFEQRKATTEAGE